jgi:glycerate 2-kinase
VNPGDTSSIASSPLIADSSSAADFRAILEKYSLLEIMPPSMSNIIKRGDIAAAPRPGKSSSIITHHVLLDNKDVVDAALSAARKMGYASHAARDIEEGNYAMAGDALIRRLVELQEKSPSNRVCLVSGGELSCPVTGGGFGGRNQEFVLYCASRFASFNTDSSIVVLSCGTDGIDGNSCAAGAIASSSTLLEAERNGLDYSVFLKANDSHSFFKKLGGLIATGPTGNNVRDIRIMLSETGKAGITPKILPGGDSC